VPFRVREEGRVVVIDLTGDFSKTLSDAVRSLIEGGKRDFVISLKNISSISSWDLGLIISLLRRVKEVSGSLKLSHLNSNIKALFEITALDRIVEIYSTDEEALKSFGG